MNTVMCSGFDEALYSIARIEGGMDRNTKIITLKKADLDLLLADIAQRASSLDDGELLDIKQRYVIFHGSRSALDGVMKGFKKAYKPSARSVIYAALTETAKGWTLRKYLEELAQEHEEMSNYQAQAGNPLPLHEQQQTAAVSSTNANADANPNAESN